MTDRQPDFPIDPIFHTRWSPRAFAPEPMPETDLLRALEAARWAPSAYNVQPWRFVYALRGDAFWERFLDVLVPFNRSWAANASALVFVVSDTLLRYEGELSPSRSHAFDAEDRQNSPPSDNNRPPQLAFRLNTSSAQPSRT